jgi:N6-L-threonylcarbamoyladenine synthase
VGEAYDKVARVLGLGYPGGPKIDKIAKEGNPEAVTFKRVMLEDGTLDFSFSGTKTGVMNYVHNEQQAGREISVPDVAASFQQAVLDTVVAKVMSATEEYGEDKIVVAGGGAANSKLREMLKDACAKKGIRLYIPAPILCTDNAAMIGCAAYYQYQERGADDMFLDAFANLDLENS